MELASQLVRDYGYLAVFIGTFLEGELILVSAGFAASQGLLAAPLVTLVAAVGAYTGHIAFFALGRNKGKDWLFGHPRLGPHAGKADRVLARYGLASIFLLQYLYGARIAGAILFGVSSFSVPRFLVLQVPNCIIWAVLVTTIGYLLGASLEVAMARLSFVSFGVVLLIVAAALAAMGISRARRRGTGSR
ncbi:MAG: DedA family protein [Leptospirillia bacterium]